MVVPEPYPADVVARYALRRRLLIERGAFLRVASDRARRVLDGVERRRNALGARAGGPPTGAPIQARPGARGRT